ncbi:hypothetical protein HIM_07173 [Hirsutella minnesotensis 3608]|uniref:GPI ethanolamine phosphate transferase 2 n=1 Tax=Hirsutella minnesotensis 3608 TaxID=1043627 RepID=A0A0F8A4D3_9HYPO|nr:hypothetical protein HIM_07173 [Hirsutella minnesotensis 3608]
MLASRNGSLPGTLLLLIANVLVPLSIFIFASGFFPHKPLLSGLAKHDTDRHGPIPEPPFDRLIFMVVDALRSDFVYSDISGFKFTQSLIRDGAAIPYTANARAPTVTMPRIKAITTGSIPSFVDLIQNINEADTSSTLSSQDTWLAQLKATGKGKLLLYGDDTWLKLFPDTFDRHDGTTSFFVSDFTEVDHNVTRNIATELERDDWSLMVLHYLGLDHIGHKSGPRSFNMLPKQQEMDGVVETLFKAMDSKPGLQTTLLVLCGDHGMNDAGNHGASSPGETSPALLFLSPKLRTISKKLPAPTLPKDEFDYYSTVEQSDIAPTLATLLGFPISKNNLGAFIPDFLPFWSEAGDKVRILVRNAQQILDIVTAAFGVELFDSRSTINPCAMASTQVNNLACEWQKVSERAASSISKAEVDEVWVTDMSNWLRQAQDLMSSMASNYDVPRLFIGQGLAIVVTLSMGAALMLGQVGATPLLLTTLSYGAMMFASSYVEEEQHFWYWSSTFWIAWLGARAVRRTARFSSGIRHLVSLVALRLARSWNQTGQKFAGEPDIVKLFLVPNPWLVWALVGLTYSLVTVQILHNMRGLPRLAVLFLCVALSLASLTFKLAFTAEDAPELVTGLAKSVNDMLQGPSLIYRARVVFVLIVVIATFSVYKGIRARRYAPSSGRVLHHLYTLLAMTQSRATNIPLLLLASIIHRCLESDSLSVSEITTSSILLQHAFFFAFGGSNAISSVDLSSAYNGVSNFNIVAVGILTFVGNWAGPIFWASAASQLLLARHRSGETLVYRRHVALLTFFAAAGAASVMAACTALRTHLFIWTVFSPKYLYCMAWTLGQHLIVNVGLGGLLFLLGKR